MRSCTLARAEKRAFNPQRSAARLAALLFAVALVVPAEAAAHSMNPTLLELEEGAGGRVQAHRRTPVLRAPGSDLAPLLPASCALAAPPAMTAHDGVLDARWVLDCEKSLVGAELGAQDIAESGADVLLRIRLVDGRQLQSVLTAEHPVFVVPERQARVDVAYEYARLGIEHILTGWDHLLFVFGLVLLAGIRLRPLAATITAFTAGHSITLCLAALGLVHVAQQPVEAAIALSILVLAVELARGPGATLLQRRPWAMALAFGLLHGLGFAGALSEAGLPSGEVPLALAAFNVGIELGQLAFVCVLILTLEAARSLPWRWPAPVRALPRLAIGGVASFLLIERVSGLLF